MRNPARSKPTISMWVRASTRALTRVRGESRHQRVAHSVHSVSVACDLQQAVRPGLRRSHRDHEHGIRRVQDGLQCLRPGSLPATKLLFLAAHHKFLWLCAAHLRRAVHRVPIDLWQMGGEGCGFPRGLCFGFGVRLPAGFTTGPKPNLPPSPQCFPGNDDWITPFTLASCERCRQTGLL